MLHYRYFLDDIVKHVTLPPHLLEHPYLQEYYGTVEWSVRGIFTTYLGWFSGDPSELHSLDPKQQAARMVKLAGGAGALLTNAKEASTSADYQWSLVCAQNVIRHLTDDAAAVVAGSVLDPLVRQAKDVMVISLRGLAEKEISANGRNYFLTYAMEVSGEMPTLQPSSTIRNGVIQQMSGPDIIKMLPIRLDAARAELVSMKVM